MKGDDEIAALGCIVCHQQFSLFTPAAVHHVRKLATSKKRKRAPRIPLCSAHHQTGGYGVAIHAGEKSWEKRYGSVIDMIKTTEIAVRNGGF